MAVKRQLNVSRAQAPSHGQEVAGSGNQRFVQCCGGCCCCGKGGQLFEAL